MSDYCKKKVLRIPFEDCHLGNPDDYSDICYDLAEKFGRDVFCCDGDAVGKFDYAPTCRPFIDFVLYDSYGEDCGEYGKVRELTVTEKLKYLDVFQKLNPCISMNKVKLVEFCWYNCSEAPDYYDPVEDEFYSEIPFICNFK